MSTPNYFFTSDNHFFHKSILHLSAHTRRGEDALQMNELMIEAFNAKVRPHDIVYFLGDFSFGNAQQTRAVVARLHGVKHLVYGNHDKVIRSDYAIQKMFASTQEYAKVHIANKTCILFHYPIVEWDQFYRNSLHFFGHVHGKKNGQVHPRSLDVGIDARQDNKMEPFAFEELLLRIENPQQEKPYINPMLETSFPSNNYMV